jgi:hypothetical protein
MAAGKSPFTAPGGVTPWINGSTAKLHAVVFGNFNIAGIRRLSGTGRGCLRCTADPRICEHGEGGLDAEALRGSPPPEGTSSSTKLQIDRGTTSSPPPPGDLLVPTLCTHRSSGIPHPPAAGAAGGGGGIPRTPDGEVEEVVGFRKSPSPHCRRERGTGQVASCRCQIPRRPLIAQTQHILIVLMVPPKIKFRGAPGCVART